MKFFSLLVLLLFCQQSLSEDSWVVCDGPLKDALVNSETRIGWESAHKNYGAMMACHEGVITLISGEHMPYMTFYVGPRQININVALFCGPFRESKINDILENDPFYKTQQGPFGINIVAIEVGGYFEYPGPDGSERHIRVRCQGNT